MAEKYLIGVEDEEVTYELERSEAETLVRRDGKGPWYRVELERIGGSDLFLLLVNNRPTEIYLKRRSGGALVTLGRHTFDVDVRPWRAGATLRTRSRAAASGLVEVAAPMTGTIIEVHCAPGDAVEDGDVLLVVEAMKMNNELKATAGGQIRTVRVSSGDKVKAGDPLVAIEARKEEPA